MAEVNFYNNPNAKREAARRRKLGEELIGAGSKDITKNTADIVRPVSGLELMANNVQKFAGQYETIKADEQEAEIEKNRQKMLSDALSKYGTDNQGAAQILAQDPETQNMAFELMGKELDFQQKKKLGEMGVGGNMPAPMQIANKMFQLEQAMSNPNMPENERFLAQRQYNLLGQTAKTYGFDRGLQVNSMDGYQNVYNQPTMPTEQPMPQEVMDIPPVSIQELQNPVQGRNTPMPPSMSQLPSQFTSGYGLNVQPMQGYGAAVADIAGQKKAAEGRAGEVGKRQGENEVLYRSMASRMPQIEDTVSRLSKLGQAATYTNLGQLRDFALRELGRDMPDAATARAEYISMVDNEILPLLRDTFGAQFTQREGESLKATLGNPNASPQEKDAVLRSFIRTKMETLGSLQRELGYGQTIPEYTSQQPLQNNRQSVIDKLKNAGVSQEEIDMYLQAKGL